MALIFVDDVAPRRLGEQQNSLKPVDPKTGFLGDFTTKTVKPAGENPSPGIPTAWLPTERVARAWQALVSETPFDQ